MFDRAAQDIGNIVELGHVNIRVPDQALATLFYVAGFGLTRDPYRMVGLDNMWVNVGASQFHLPTGPAQVLRGVTGLVLPDIDATERGLNQVWENLQGTKFSVARAGDMLDVMCPWGNRIRCHAPDETRFGPVRLGMAYVEIDAAPGTTESIARFYRDVFGAPVVVDQGATRITAGVNQHIIYRESPAPPPEFDGHHIQITLADFSGPHRKLQEHGLITEESNQSQYRFEVIQDNETGCELARLEHEVRSMHHPQYNRRLTNRGS